MAKPDYIATSPSPLDRKTEWVDPDDAPELTAEWFEEADAYVGDTLVQKGKNFDKRAYQREYMRKRRAADKAAKVAK